jgi:hypothetical protein
VARCEARYELAGDDTPYVAWEGECSGDAEIYVHRWSGSSWEEVEAGSATGGISAITAARVLSVVHPRQNRTRFFPYKIGCTKKLLAEVGGRYQEPFYLLCDCVLPSTTRAVRAKGICLLCPLILGPDVLPFLRVELAAAGTLLVDQAEVELDRPCKDRRGKPWRDGHCFTWPSGRWDIGYTGDPDPTESDHLLFGRKPPKHRF